MNVVNIFKGKRGEKGSDGLDGILASNIRQILIDSPLLELFHTNKQSVVSRNSSSNRLGEALIENEYGGFTWVSSDDRTNYIKHNNDFSQWQDQENKWSIVNTTTLDPYGGNDATLINIDQTISDTDVFGIQAPTVTGVSSVSAYTFSMWFRVVSGSVSQLNIGASTIFRIEDVGGGWHRLKHTIVQNLSSGFFSFLPVCAAGTRIAIYKAQLENGSIMTDEIDTTSSPVTVINNNPSIRSNFNGYLFEGAAQNLIKNSEYIISPYSWVITNGVVDTYNERDMFGQLYSPILVNNNGFTTTTISSDVDAIPGTEYFLSFFARVAGGSVSSVSASIGDNGQSASISDITLGEMKRYSMPLIAGIGGYVSVRVTSSDGNGLVALSGMQLETIETTSYIRNAGISNIRGTDANITDYTIKRADDSWTFQFTDIVEVTDTKKYIFHNTMTDHDEFCAYFQSGNLYIKNGLETIETLDISESLSLGATFDGVNLLVYKEGYLINSGVFTGPSTATPSQLYIGTDQSFENSIDGYLSLLSFWGDALTSEEMRFIGVTND